MEKRGKVINLFHNYDVWGMAIRSFPFCFQTPLKSESNCVVTNSEKKKMSSEKKKTDSEDNFVEQKKRNRL